MIFLRALLTVCPDEQTKQSITSLGNDMVEEMKEEQNDSFDTAVKEALSPHSPLKQIISRRTTG